MEKIVETVLQLLAGGATFTVEGIATELGIQRPIAFEILHSLSKRNLVQLSWRDGFVEAQIIRQAPSDEKALGVLIPIVYKSSLESAIKELRIKGCVTGEGELTEQDKNNIDRWLNILICRGILGIHIVKKGGQYAGNPDAFTIFLDDIQAQETYSGDDPPVGGQASSHSQPSSIQPGSPSV